MAYPDRGVLVAYARKVAQANGVDPNIFVAQIQQESGFNPAAHNPSGASGIAQLMPQYYPGVDTSDPYASLDAAAKTMGQNIKKYKGDYAKALAAYNAGGGNVDKYGGVPPFAETQSYVKTILGSKGDTMGQMQEGTPPASTDPFDAYLAAKLKQMGGGSSGPNTQVVQDGQGNWQLVNKDDGTVTPLNIAGNPPTSDTRNNILASGSSPSDKYIVYFDAAGNLKTEPNPNYLPAAKNTVPGTGTQPLPDYSGTSQGGSDPSGPSFSGGTPDMPVDVYNALQAALKSQNADDLAAAKFKYEQWHDAQTRQDALDKQNAPPAPLDPTEQAYKQALTAKLQADTLAIQKALRGVAQAAFSDFDGTITAISDQYKAGKITFPEMNALIEQAHQGLTATLAGTTLMEQQKEAHAVQAAKSRDATDLLNQRVQSSASLGASLFQSATGHVLMPKGQTSLGIDPLAIANQEVDTQMGGSGTGNAAAAFLKGVFGGGDAGVGAPSGASSGAQFPTTREGVLAMYPHLGQAQPTMGPEQTPADFVPPNLEKNAGGPGPAPNGNIATLLASIGQGR